MVLHPPVELARLCRKFALRHHLPLFRSMSLRTKFLDTGRLVRTDPGQLSNSLGESRSVEFLSESDKKPFRPVDVAEPIRVLKPAGRGFAPSCSTHVVPRLRRCKHGAPVQGEERCRILSFTREGEHCRSLHYFQWDLVQGITGLKSETWGTLRFLPSVLQRAQAWSFLSRRSSG